METERFRIFFWQKFVPLPGLVVLGALLTVSPVADGWPRATWYAVVAVAIVAVAGYLANAWATSAVLLDERGITLHLPGGLTTIGYADLIRATRHGRWRVRLCVDAGLADRHRHVSMDIWDAAGFIAELERRGAAGELDLAA
ncbi:MAG TPA: hypothetical protein VNM91_09465 [Dehalococcoidia bacterium]|nr:hypothetical protein [Dehalococcoidia bacterium]